MVSICMLQDCYKLLPTQCGRMQLQYIMNLFDYLNNFALINGLLQNLSEQLKLIIHEFKNRIIHYYYNFSSFLYKQYAKSYLFVRYADTIYHILIGFP